MAPRIRCHAPSLGHLTPSALTNTYPLLMLAAMNEHPPPTPPPGRLDDLLRPDVLDAFDREQYERDGFWVWDGILTDAGRQRWSASLKRLQAMNDEILMQTDWQTIDFEGCGLKRPPAENFTPEALAGFCGGSEQMPVMDGLLRQYMHGPGFVPPRPTLSAASFEPLGFMPEFFPQAYDDFMMDVTTTHPQMKRLFRNVLGEHFVLDHCVMLNRTAESEGRRWHAHRYRDGSREEEDQVGDGRLKTTGFLSHQCVRTLIYPEGATIEDGGELSLIRGAHLYRVPYMDKGPRTDYDADIESRWLKGKIHGFTRESLKVEKLSLRPGSIVSLVHHMPHGVGHRAPNAPTRWGVLIAFRTPDETAPADERWTKGVPAHWADRMVAEGRLSSEAHRLFESDVLCLAKAGLDKAG